MTDEPLTIFVVEVTVAAAIVLPDGRIAGGNMVDTTLSFGWRTGEPPAGLSDAAMNEGLLKGVSPVLAIIQTAMTFNGWIAMGEVDDPMTDHSKATGETARSKPVRVQVSFPDEGAAVHD